MLQKKSTAKKASGSNKKSPKGGDMKKERRKTCDRWTEEEKERLVEAVEIFGQRSWNEIAKHVGTKNSDQCNQHWHRVLNPRISKNPWSQEEDERLSERVTEFGESAWKKVSEGFEGRTDIQCRHRWIMLIRTGKVADIKSGPKKAKPAVERTAKPPPPPRQPRQTAEKPARSAASSSRLKKRSLSSESESWTEEDDDEDSIEVPRHITRHQTRATAAAATNATASPPSDFTYAQDQAYFHPLAPYAFPAPASKTSAHGMKSPPSRSPQAAGPLMAPISTATESVRFHELADAIEEEIDACHTNTNISESADYTATEGSPYLEHDPFFYGHHQHPDSQLASQRRSSLPDVSFGPDPLRFKRRQSLPFVTPPVPLANASPSQSPTTTPRTAFFSGRSHRQKVRVRETPEPQPQEIPPPIFLPSPAATVLLGPPRHSKLGIASPVYSPRGWVEPHSAHSSTPQDPWQWRAHDPETNSDSYLSDTQTEECEPAHHANGEGATPTDSNRNFASTTSANAVPARAVEAVVEIHQSPTSTVPASACEPEVDPLPLSLEALNVQDDWLIYDVDGSIIDPGELRVGKGEEALSAYFSVDLDAPHSTQEEAPQDSPTAAGSRETPHSDSQGFVSGAASTTSATAGHEWQEDYTFAVESTTVAFSIMKNNSQSQEPRSYPELDMDSASILSPISVNDLCSPISSLDANFDFGSFLASTL